MFRPSQRGARAKSAHRSLDASDEGRSVARLCLTNDWTDCTAVGKTLRMHDEAA